MKFNNQWNVIREDDFKEGLKTVFDQVADALTNTLGPYGTTTIIEKYGEHHITKDGFQVLKSINYADQTLNNFLMLLFRISAQVVFQVGDGSTSSIVAANEIIKKFDEYDKFISDYRPKELIDIISKCVDTIVGKLYLSATPITDANNFDEIRKIATVSTNGNEDIANMIVDIYKKTGNPSIEFTESKTDETSYEIIDGYTANITYLDTTFATHDDGICRINNGAYVLMFDHKIDLDNAVDLIQAGKQICVQARKRLVVIAPAYDKLLLDFIRREVNLEIKATGTSTVVYCRASLINNMSHILYNDFSVMCGAQVITERYDDKITPTEVVNYIGQVGTIEIGPKTTLIRGLGNRNEELYTIVCRDAELKYAGLVEKYKNAGVVDTDLTEAKNRLTKLRCSMGAIRVGGGSSLEKKALYDLVDDAVRACESAYRYGYNIGGNLSIVYTIMDILKDGDVSVAEASIYGIIRDAFIGVFRHVLVNKYGEKSDKPDEIIRDILDRYTDTHESIGYNLITEEYSDDIINSCRTDIEILRGALSVISLLVTSNQYISITTHQN